MRRLTSAQAFQHSLRRAKSAPESLEDAFAGSRPTGAINRHTLELLRRLNHPTGSLRSKSWEEFATAASPPLDFVITVCDSAAGEVCPVWPGQPMTAHWGFPDPASFVGTEAGTSAHFSDIYRQIGNRIDIFVNLPMESLDRLSLQKRLDEIGQKLPVRA